MNTSIKILKQNNDYTQDQIDIIVYGLESIYLTITKMIVIFGAAYILGILKEVLLLLITYNVIRSQAFGLHATKSIYCLISSLILFIGGALLCKYITIPKYIMVVISVICNLCLFLYAPADTYKRPLINKKRRMRFKILSTFFGIVYTVLIIIYNGSYFASYLLLGMIFAVVMILPVTYQVFKLPYNNYKNYKYGV